MLADRDPIPVRQVIKGTLNTAPARSLTARFSRSGKNALLRHRGRAGAMKDGRTNPGLIQSTFPQ